MRKTFKGEKELKNKERSVEILWKYLKSLKRTNQIYVHEKVALNLFNDSKVINPKLF